MHKWIISTPLCPRSGLQQFLQLPTGKTISQLCRTLVRLNSYALKTWHAENTKYYYCLWTQVIVVDCWWKHHKGVSLCNCCCQNKLDSGSLECLACLGLPLHWQKVLPSYWIAPGNTFQLSPQNQGFLTSSHREMIPPGMALSLMAMLGYPECWSFLQWLSRTWRWQAQLRASEGTRLATPVALCSFRSARNARSWAEYKLKKNAAKCKVQSWELNSFRADLSWISSAAASSYLSFLWQR